MYIHLSFIAQIKVLFLFRRCYKGRQEMFPDIPDPDPTWLAKDFETCVLSGDVQCTYIEEDPRNIHMIYQRQMMYFCGHDDECM
jgi:dermatan/chondrotin sulfate uronyl 2-O-sulfotransferase UST